MKVEDLFEQQLDEGPLDYIKGIGKHLGKQAVDKFAEKGRQIAKPFIQAHQEGRQASQEGDVRSLTKQKQQLMQQLIELADQTSPQVVLNIINKTFAQKYINLAKNPLIIQPCSSGRDELW